jgi:hypothetical protein
MTNATANPYDSVLEIAIEPSTIAERQVIALESIAASLSKIADIQRLEVLNEVVSRSAGIKAEPDVTATGARAAGAAAALRTSITGVEEGPLNALLEKSWGRRLEEAQRTKDWLQSPLV